MKSDTMEFDALKEKIILKLKEIYDPEIVVNIYDLGLIYSIDCEENEDTSITCIITMTLTSANCPVSGVLYDLVSNIGYCIEEVEDLETIPKLVFDPPWTKEMMSDDAKLALGLL